MEPTSVGDLVDSARWEAFVGRRAELRSFAEALGVTEVLWPMAIGTLVSSG
jgi:hypothetical protein